MNLLLKVENLPAKCALQTFKVNERAKNQWKIHEALRTQHTALKMQITFAFSNPSVEATRTMS